MKTSGFREINFGNYCNEVNEVNSMSKIHCVAGDLFLHHKPIKTGVNVIQDLQRKCWCTKTVSLELE